jgi:hypothetical protein
MPTPPPAQTNTAQLGHDAGTGCTPRLQRRTAWADHDGPLPIIEGSLIELRVHRLPGDKHPKPVWLWHSRPDTTAAETGRCWQAFLRRFDIEHTFRFCKQTLGWTRPKIRTPEQGDRWTWLIVAAHTQPRLARGLTTDLRLPWEKPVTDPARLTPARVRRGFRHLRARTARPASAPETLPARPRPTSRSRKPSPRHPPRRR